MKNVLRLACALTLPVALGLAGAAWADQPMNGQPMNGAPMSSQPMSGQPMSGQPMSGQPMTDTPMTSSPAQPDSMSSQTQPQPKMDDQAKMPPATGMAGPTATPPNAD
jgi:pentapeptide MXKDX repeat protein